MSSYRERIDRYLESHPGATIQEARGHGHTPEHIGQGRNEPKFSEYYERRDELERHAKELKERAYGQLPTYNAERSANSIERASIADLEIAVEYEDIDELLIDHPELEDEFGHYH